MNIDIRPDGAIKRVHVSQNDVGRTLTFELFNNSTSYTIPSGATVKIQGTKPSGLGFSETCTVSGNVVTVDTTETMTDEYGYIDTELSISYNGNTIGTSNFILAVERNPHPSNITDGTQITAQSLQDQIDELRDEIESGGSGLTDGAKQALLNCFAHVAWIDEHGQDYYDALEDALYPPATLVSISCVYTQSGTVYETDSLDSLKADLVVTAHYDNSTTQTVTTYTLSGTLTVGTSTITVTYGGKITTFDVTVSEYVVPPLYNWDFTQSLTDTSQGNVATTTATQTSGIGLVYNAMNQYTLFEISSYLDKTFEIDVQEIGTRVGGNHRRLFLLYGSNSSQQAGLICNAGSSWKYYSGNAWDSTSIADADASYFNGKTVKIYVSNTGSITVSRKDIGASDSTYEQVYASTIGAVASVLDNATHCTIGWNSASDGLGNATIKAMRIYNGEV